GSYTLSPAEVMALIAEYMVLQQRGNDATVALPSSVYGPSVPPARLTESVEASRLQFERSVEDLHNSIQRNHQIPNAVWLGSTPLSPEAFLVAMARIATKNPANGNAPEMVKIAPARLATENYIAEASPKLWSWPIFPPGFHSEHLMELARLQAWTL